MFLCAFDYVHDFSKTKELISLKCYVGRTWGQRKILNFWKDPDYTLNTQKKILNVQTSQFH